MQHTLCTHCIAAQPSAQYTKEYSLQQKDFIATNTWSAALQVSKLLQARDGSALFGILSTMQHVSMRVVGTESIVRWSIVAESYGQVTKAYADSRHRTL